MIKKFFLSFLVIASFVFYAVHERGEQSEAKVLLPPMQPTMPPEEPTVTPVPPTPETAGPFGPPSQTTPQPTAIPPTKQVRRYKDGAYIGNVTDAIYGNIQVKAIIQDGALVDVQFLQYPNDRRTSVEINQQAMPYLKTEAIQSQNSQVDIVSGATDSSLAFRDSLASALAQAKN